MLGRSASGVMPDLVEPMQTGTGELPPGPDWAVEFAWAGLRVIAYVRPNRLKLLTATGRAVTTTFPDLEDPLVRVAPRRGMVLDGTVVALGEAGFPRRRLLQSRSGTQRPSEALMRRVPVGFLASDVLWLDGRSTVELPYHRRRDLLEELVFDRERAWSSPSFPADGLGQVMVTAEQHGADALYAKHLGAPYRPGRRSRYWLRLPVRPVRQVVVGGWSPADPRRPESIGALLLGVPQGARLRYVGRVGLRSAEERSDVADVLPALRRTRSPFTAGLPGEISRHAGWVEPRLVARVEFTDWTPDGRLRLPIWRGVVPADQVEAAQFARRVEARRLEQHFVYNSLSTIASLVRTDPSRARELLLGFADLTRAADQPADATSTLGHELAAVRSYLQLEQARFGKRLRVEIDVDAGLHALPVAPLQVLAAVRATVQQGIEPRPEGGTLTLTAEPAEGGCVLRIADDGAGEPTLVVLRS